MTRNELPHGSWHKSDLLLLTNIPAPYRIPVWNQLDRLSGGGLRVVFTERSWPHRNWALPAAQMNFKWNFLSRSPCSVSLRGRFRAVGATLRLLAQSRPRTVVCGGYDNLPDWVSFVWCKLFRRRFVLWVESNARDHRRSGRIRSPLKRLIISRADAIAVPGRAALNYVRQLGAKKNGLVVVRNGFDVDLFGREAEKVDAVREKALHGYPPGLILCAGRLIQMKGVLTLLEAFRQVSAELPLVGLLVVGDGAERSAMESFCNTARLRNVYFEGRQPYERMPYYYALADVLALPTFSDPHPLSVAEAFACGTPAIVSRVAGVCEDLLIEGKTGFTVEAGDPRDLADKILHFFRHPELRVRMSGYCRDLIKDHSADFTARGLWGAASPGRKTTQTWN